MTTQAEVKNDFWYIPVLNHGFVGIKDMMPRVLEKDNGYIIPSEGDLGEGDKAIVEAARTSYGKGTKKVSTDRGLIRYLMRHRHTTPFEMVEIKFHCKMPIFVARQWIRHRTANVNEYSGRYSEMPDEFYVPDAENTKPQAASNRQGREGSLNEWDTIAARTIIDEANERSYADYQRLLGEEQSVFTPEFEGLAKEIARSVLSLNNYTEWYWKIDLHNLFHFLSLRMDPHAQYEIRVYAEHMYRLIKPLVPVAIEAFQDYRLDAETFSGPEMRLMRALKNFHSWKDFLVVMESDEKVCEKFKLSARELREFKEKFPL